ncbi:MAG: LysE family transporter [Flavobacteriales bacterium]|nr:LysE family transporter [Flavobacteriales bacterium]
MPFLEGFIIGLGTLVFIGPVFFTLIQASLQFGWKAGMSVALGVISGDLLCVILYLYGLDQFLKNPLFLNSFAIIGGLFLISLGLKHIIRPALMLEVQLAKQMDLATSFIKGFAINFINPFVFMVWAGIVLLAKTKFENPTDSFVFLGACLLAIFLTDSLKSVFAFQIKNILSPIIIKTTFRLIGILMIGFGLRLLLYLL